ncbi:hypothetical protein PIB30_046517 [Stylosanthes scabra]|uniref:Uncharacterized protein n=1 Tax=Stylosanthes scabra TaxID=79078 RepID=A0ABU6ZF77_9FABA|nr:hypothetical protein [Stylosanthes scabra]
MDDHSNAIYRFPEPLAGNESQMNKPDFDTKPVLKKGTRFDRIHPISDQTKPNRRGPNVTSPKVYQASQHQAWAKRGSYKAKASLSSAHQAMFWPRLGMTPNVAHPSPPKAHQASLENQFFIKQELVDV